MQEIDPALNDRLENLEIKTAFQEDLIESLNQVVARQDEVLRRLEREVEEMTETLQQSLQAGEASPSADQQPPHY